MISKIKLFSSSIMLLLLITDAAKPTVPVKPTTAAAVTTAAAPTTALTINPANIANTPIAVQSAGQLTQGIAYSTTGIIGICVAAIIGMIIVLGVIAGLVSAVKSKNNSSSNLNNYTKSVRMQISTLPTGVRASFALWLNANKRAAAKREQEERNRKQQQGEDDIELSTPRESRDVYKDKEEVDRGERKSMVMEIVEEEESKTEEGNGSIEEGDVTPPVSESADMEQDRVRNSSTPSQPVNPKPVLKPTTLKSIISTKKVPQSSTQTIDKLTPTPFAQAGNSTGKSKQNNKNNAPPKPPQPRASQFLQRFSIFRNSGSKKDESKEDQKKREAEEAEERRYHNAI